MCKYVLMYLHVCVIIYNIEKILKKPFGLSSLY